MTALVGKNDFSVRDDGNYVMYTTTSGDRQSLYVGDYDITVTPEEIEEDFDSMIDQCGGDAPDRKALIDFMYFVVITNYLSSYEEPTIDKFLHAAWNTEGLMRTIWLSKAFAFANR